MESNSYSGESLEKALQEGVLTQSQVVLTGIVKPSEKSGYVGFSQIGCDELVDLPTSMIAQADHISQYRCGDHTHPIMRITLNEMDSLEGKVLLELLEKAMPHQGASTVRAGSKREPLPIGIRGSVPHAQRVATQNGSGLPDTICDSAGVMWCKDGSYGDMFVYYMCGSCIPSGFSGLATNAFAWTRLSPPVFSRGRRAESSFFRPGSWPGDNLPDTICDSNGTMWCKEENCIGDWCVYYPCGSCISHSLGGRLVVAR